MKRLAVLLLWVVSVGVAGAQEPRPLSARERAYGATLARELGEPAGQVLPIRRPWTPGRNADGMLESSLAGSGDEPAPQRRPAPDEVEITGVLVRANGLDVERLKFPSAELARDYAAHDAQVDEGRVVAELRGDQVLLIRGAGLENPTVARQALDAGWRGLPHAPATEATYAGLGQGDIVLFTTETRGAIPDAIGHVIQSARDHTATAPEGTFQWRGPADVQVALRNGLRARAHGDAKGGWVWSTMSPDRSAQMQHYLTVLTGVTPSIGDESPVTQQTAPASVGTRRVVDGLFGEPQR